MPVRTALIVQSDSTVALSKPIVSCTCACATTGHADAAPTSAMKSRRFTGCPSYQPHPLQTRMPVLADDDVIVNRNAERSGDVDDRLGHLDVRLRWRRIA